MVLCTCYVLLLRGFLFNVTPTSETYTSLHTRSRHDALPISFDGCRLHALGSELAPRRGLASSGAGSPSQSSPKPASSLPARTVLARREQSSDCIPAAPHS